MGQIFCILLLFDCGQLLAWQNRFFNLFVMFCLDTGPLVRIKQALTRLKQEVQQMDVRIGVVSFVDPFAQKKQDIGQN